MSGVKGMNAGTKNYRYKHGETKMADGFTKTAKEKGMFVGWWIPVDERLPEVGSEVLVCYDFKGKRSVYIANFYGDGEFHGLDDEYLTSEGRKYRKAVAWMPLPQPYKEGSEDSK